MTPFRILFKHKLNLNKCIPNTILHTSLLYNLRSLYDTKIQSIFTNLTCQLNDPNITGCTTIIHLHQLQFNLNLPECPLIFWPFTFASVFQDPITDLLSVLPDFRLSFNYYSRWSNKILGGSTHLTAEHSGHLYFIT